MTSKRLTLPETPTTTQQKTKTHTLRKTQGESARAVHSVVELIASVDAAFVETGRGLAGWEDPHPGRMPLVEEYSRLTNPQKWGILGARAEAWLKALAAAGLAEIEPDAGVVWEEQPRVDVVRVQRALPLGIGAIPLIFAWTRFGEALAWIHRLGVGGRGWGWVGGLGFHAGFGVLGWGRGWVGGVGECSAQTTTGSAIGLCFLRSFYRFARSKF